MKTNIELSEYELNQLGQALSYAVVYAKTEKETADFAMLKVKVEGLIADIPRRKKFHNEIKSLEGCPFHYCDNNPKCVNKCRYA